MKISVRSGKAIIEGYVNVTERLSKPIRDARGTFIEKVAQGAFQRALDTNHNVGLMFNHIRKLGDQLDGTLELKEDEVGLYARAVINDAEVVEKAENKKLKGWSFGFNELKSKWEQVGEQEVRKLEEIYLEEVSILDIQPAYAATTISMRADKEELLEHRAEVSAEGIEYDIEVRNTIPDEEINKKYKEVIKELKVDA